MKRIALLLFTASRLFGSIALDATSSTTGDTASSYTWTHTVTGTKPALYVMCGYYSATPRSISGITFNGSSFTKLDSNNVSNRWAEQWYIVGPATGAHSIVVTFNGALNQSFEAVWCSAVSLTGVDQSNPINTHTSSAIGSIAAFGTVTISTTTTKDNAWLVGGFMSNNWPGMNDGASQTRDFTCNNCTTSPVVDGAVSHKGPNTPVGAKTLTWTISTNNTMDAITALITSFAPDVPLAVKHKVERQ